MRAECLSTEVMPLPPPSGERYPSRLVRPMPLPPRQAPGHVRMWDSMVLTMMRNEASGHIRTGSTNWVLSLPATVSFRHGITTQPVTTITVSAAQTTTTSARASSTDISLSTTLRETRLILMTVRRVMIPVTRQVQTWRI